MENFLTITVDNLTMVYGGLVLVLIFISAFFSISETALTTSSKAKIHRLAREGNRRALTVERLLRNKESMIGTILLMNNAVNILASAIATSVLIKMFGETGVVYATIIMTILVVVFAEIAPKTFALKNPEKISLLSAGSILFLVKIFYPITKSLQKFIDKTFKFFGVAKKHTQSQDLISDLDEIRGTIDLKHKSGAIFKYDKDMLDSILDLSETEIGDIVIHRKNIDSINIDQEIGEIIKQAISINHTRIPLWRGNQDNIVAILQMRKLVNFLHNKKGDFKNLALEDFTTEPWFVPATNNIRSQLVAFRKKREKFAVVIDEYGVLVGIITLEDILEEIVGDITDEDDKPVKINRFKDGSYKISGELPIRDINRKLNWNLPENDENASTLAGLVISRIERIPEESEEFIFDDFSFKILKMRQNKIVFLKVKKI